MTPTNPWRATREPQMHTGLGARPAHSFPLVWVCLLPLIFVALTPLQAVTSDSSPHEKSNLHGKELEEVLQGYALLNELTNQEARLDQILIIRNAPPATEVLLKDISSEAQDLKKDLETFRKYDPAFHTSPTTDSLPELEIAARKLITRETSNRLIFGKQADFDIEILLSQAAALGYGESLLVVIAQHDDVAERRTNLILHSGSWKKLRLRVVELLKK